VSVAGPAARAALGILRILRPINALLAALGVLAGILMTFGGPTPALTLTMAPLSAALITSAGNVLNDLRDVDVDRTAHPSRPLPRGDLAPRAAAQLLAGLVSIGLAAALLCGLATFLFAAGTGAVLLLYEARLKRTGLLGNAAVALLTAATFLYGAVAAGHVGGPVILAAAMAFLVNLAREIEKDAEDLEADAATRRTFPMRVGSHAAGLWAAASALAGIVASMLFLAPFLWPGSRDCNPGIVTLSLLAMADAAVLAGALAAVARPERSQQLLKLGMGLALLAFLALPTLALQSRGCV